MSLPPFESTIREKIAEILRHPGLTLPLSEDTANLISGLGAYLELWQKWNQKINLTAETDPIEVLERHVFDSLQYARVLSPGLRVLDVGSGAGFPGIPLKLLIPSLRMVLVEKLRKRASFLRTVIAHLGLADISVLNQRCEALENDPQYAGQFDRVLFRAVGKVGECLRMGLPFLSPQGWVILKKSPEDSPQNQEYPGIVLKETLPITRYDGKPSVLWVFARRSTWNNL